MCGGRELAVLVCDCVSGRDVWVPGGMRYEGTHVMCISSGQSGACLTIDIEIPYEKTKD